MENNYILSSTDDTVGIITINKPANMNALDFEMLASVVWQIKNWEQDENIKAIVLQGNDKFFVSGIDINELIAEANQSESKIFDMQKCIERIANSQKPVIAAVSGAALGIGLELALACDFILAADNAVFACPEASLSFIPAFGGIQRLVRTIGKSKSSEMILTGKALQAEEALSSGIVSRIIPLANLKEDALKTAKRIGSISTSAAQLARESIKTAQNNLHEGILSEQKSAKICFLENDFKQSLLNLQNKGKKA
ncbi:MAG: enoyl-CoA hydratase/isomerase family protein [Alphaproteobacteria bacterium]